MTVTPGHCARTAPRRCRRAMLVDDHDFVRDSRRMVVKRLQAPFEIAPGVVADDECERVHAAASSAATSLRRRASTNSAASTAGPASSTAPSDVSSNKRLFSAAVAPRDIPFRNIQRRVAAHSRATSVSSSTDGTPEPRASSGGWPNPSTPIAARTPVPVHTARRARRRARRAESRHAGRSLPPQRSPANPRGDACDCRRRSRGAQQDGSRQSA